MHTSDRRGARAWGAAALLVAALASGCGSQPATPMPTAAATPVVTPAPTPAPVAYADTLRIGVNLGASRSWQPLTEFGSYPALTFGRLVYSSLYRYGARGNLVPDITDGPCFVPGADGTVIRCRLIETTFHDGTPLTADDVAYTYQIMSRPVMGGTPSTLTEVRAVDPRTVDFVFSSVDATCQSCVLPQIPIFSRHSIDEAVAAFDEATKDLTAEGLDKLADDINAEISRDPPVCSDARLGEVEAIYRKLGYDILLHHEDGLKENGEYDVCSALGWGAINLDTSTNWGGGSIGYALSQTGIDRVAGIVGQMAWGRPDIFVGTGPYRYVSQDADSVHFEAFAGYHGGLAATRYVDFVRPTGDGSDLVAGTVDILSDASLGTAFEATAAGHGVHVLHSPRFWSFVLTFNVREGRLFADVNLRKALQLCIDLPRDVDAATGGVGVAIYSPVIPGSWGDDPDLPKPDRDVAAGKRLIEASGWTLGSDGVYARGKLPLAAKIIVRDVADRVKMADLIAAQARDCGMDLESLVIDDYGDLVTYPHHIPGTETPFDIVVVGLGSDVDPGNALSWYASSEVSDAKHPDAANMGGFSDPAFDRLLAEAKVTYDQAERTRLYRQAQEELAARLPALFLWNMALTNALRSTVATADGPLDLTVPNWAWQPERMVVVSNP